MSDTENKTAQVPVPVVPVPVVPESLSDEKISENETPKPIEDSPLDDDPIDLPERTIPIKNAAGKSDFWKVCYFSSDDRSLNLTSGRVREYRNLLKQVKDYPNSSTKWSS